MGPKTLVLPSYLLYNISMKVWAYKVFSVLLSALVVLASADVAFAGPKKLPKLKRIKTLAPKTVLPKTPTVPVVKPKVAAQVERVVTQKAVTAPQVAPVNTPQAAPIPAAVQDTGTNLTGTQVLAQYFPTWRQELGGKFSPEQLDAVEKAFADTDEWMFVRGEDGELKARNKYEWDYEARFLTFLQNSGVSFTDKQIKQLIGGKGIKGFTFKIYFFRMKATGFSCSKGTKPLQNICRGGVLLSYKEMTPEEVHEVNIGKGLNRYLNHPLVKAYLQENRLYAESKTPEEYVTLARQYPTKPRAEIWKDGHKLSRAEMTPKEVQEVNIGMGLYKHRNHPFVKAYLQENRLYAKSKTPEEYVELARQYPTKPRSQIYGDHGHILAREEMTPQEVQEVNIGQGLYRYHTHPLVQTYIKENRLQSETQTTQQLYTALTTHIKEYGHYPTRAENSLQSIIYQRLRYYESTMTTDGKYTDPYLQKIYEIKQWSERVKRGEVDWDKFPGLFKKHRRTLDEMHEQEESYPKKK